MKIVLTAGSFLALATAGVLAQQNPNAAAQTYQSLSQREQTRMQLDQFKAGLSVPELFQEEGKDVGPQTILKLNPRRRYVELSSDSQFFYTSNMLLTESPAARTATSLMVNTVQLALAPDPYTMAGHALAPRLGFRHQWFNYSLDDGSSKLNNFDFDAQTIFTDARYAFAENWVLNAGIDYTRLLGHQPGVTDYNEFYTEFVPRWGVERYFPLGERQLIRVGYLGEYHLSHVDAFPPVLASGRNDRIDQTLLVSYTHAFTPHLVAQPFYRFQYSGYTGQGTDRNDYLNTLGLSLNWIFNQHAGIRLFVSYDLRESDHPLVADYRKFDTGGGLSLNWRF